MSRLWGGIGEGAGGGYPSRLVLARHGETDWNRTGRWQGQADVPLNDRGREQAAGLAKRLAEWHFDAVYTSPLARARATADVVAGSVGLDAVDAPALMEIALGAWEGLTSQEVADRFPDDVAAIGRGEDPPRGGGETLGQLRERVSGFFEGRRDAHAGHSLLLIAHGGANKALVAHLLGLPISHQARISSRGNTGLTVFEFANGFPQLMLLNDVCHTDGLAR